ncbi:toll/interleukin-1 receptor domain-containing protein [Roseiconus lacunae]|uniref:toll/interleukin-1 receptor domain-containing protein n=1 Tax=Roseiconus lacunae TaxID=2605694 RepID=UPI001E295B7E|nr:toll/interleukin-1 receptor domain-containing protein [Roseiconus lacunae]MCD0460074.1 toll/interleukin-1 receptor domain-containing protein [Roseiconus lacunae]
MKVFLAYSPAHADELASQIADAIGGLGFHVAEASKILSPGDDIWQRIRDELVTSDAMVVLWSGENTTNLMHEFGFFLGSNPKKPVILVRLNNSPLPFDLRHRQFLDGQDVPPEQIAAQVAASLSKLEGARRATEEKAEARQATVEKTSEAYIDESLQSLSERERRYQFWALLCYAAGYVTLLLGLWFATYRALTEPPALSDMPQSVYLCVVTIAIIGFLAASARFAFVLGKSFMVEALRNHDRVHAMKFGEFYLKAFGDTANWEEVKDAFQHWNLDTGSTFKDQSDESIDPQVLKMVNEIIKNVRP